MQRQLNITFTIDEVSEIRDMQNDQIFHGVLPDIKGGAFSYYGVDKKKLKLMLLGHQFNWKMVKTPKTFGFKKDDIMFCLVDWDQRTLIENYVSKYGLPTKVQVQEVTDFGVKFILHFATSSTRRTFIQQKFKVASCCLYAPNRMQKINVTCREASCQRVLYRCKVCKESFKPEVLERIIALADVDPYCEKVNEACDKNHLKRPIRDLYIESDDAQEEEKVEELPPPRKRERKAVQKKQVPHPEENGEETEQEIGLDELQASLDH